MMQVVASGTGTAKALELKNAAEIIKGENELPCSTFTTHDNHLQFQYAVVIIRTAGLRDE